MTPTITLTHIYKVPEHLYLKFDILYMIEILETDYFFKWKLVTVIDGDLAAQDLG